MRKFETIADIPEDATPEEVANFWEEMDELEWQCGVFAGTPEIFEDAEKEAEEIYQKILRRMPGEFQFLVDATQKDCSN